MSLRTLGDVVRRAGGAVSVRDDVSVSELARALHAHRVDAAAVLTEAGVLAGLATATDVARTLARAEDPDATPVASIMTVHPAMLPPAESPGRALATMKAGGFRHLPVVDPASGAVLGIVDVLHLAYDAIVRLHSSYALPPTKRSFLFQRAARETIEKPTLRAFGDLSRFTALLPDHTALDACEALVRNKAQAIIVVDATGVLEGIFTSRDVASRVVAAGRAPSRTRLRDVMTPRPDFALPDFTVLECLQRMQACGFRHLPIVDEASQRVVGLVDVLQLASDALSGLEERTQAQQGQSPSQVLRPGSPGSLTRPRVNGVGDPPPFSSIFTSLFSSGVASGAADGIPPVPRANAEDVPADGVDASPGLRPIGAPREDRARRSRSPSAATSSTGSRQISKLNAADLARMRMSSQFAPGGVYAPGGGSAGPGTVTFKFKDSNGDYRRIKVPRVATRGSYDQLVIDVRHRFYGNSSNGVAGSGSIRIKYIDEEGDAVVISNDDDLAGCFEECTELKLKTVKLKVTEVQSRRSLTSSVQSPVSSRPMSPRPMSPRPLSPRPVETVGSDSNSQTGSHSTDMATMTTPPTGLNVLSPVLSPSTSRAAEAHALMMDQHLAQAIEKYDEAVRINSSNARALAGRGAAKLITGDTNGAETDYRESLRLMEESVGRHASKGDRDRTFDMVVVGLVETLIDQRRYEQAAEVADKLSGKPSKTSCADALRDELDSSSAAARSALDSGVFGEAMALFSNAIRVEAVFLQVSDGRDAPAASLRNGRGKCYLDAGDFDMALEDFEAASKMDPESVAAHKGCGKCYIELERAEEAYEAYVKAGKLDVADDEVQEQIRVLRGMLPDPTEEKKVQIAKLGVMLDGLNLPGAPNVKVSTSDLPRPASRAASSVATSASTGTSLAAKRKARKARKKNASPSG